jgi:hypothetical protein
MNDRIKEIQARCNAATPGPWMWHVNEHCKVIKLLTKHSGQYYVMGFERWGMQGAQPTFQAYEKYEGPVRERGSKGIKKAIELSKWAQTYRHNDGWIEHPDAEFIANSKSDVEYLLSELKAKDAEIERLTAKTEKMLCKYCDREILIGQIQRLKAELEAAIEDLSRAVYYDCDDFTCGEICKKFDTETRKYTCGDNCNFEWRGRREEA